MNRLTLICSLLLGGPAWSAESAVEIDQAPIQEHFQFGSYGRASIGSDLYGSTGRQVRMIAHPPRLLETPYAEIDLAYTHEVRSTGTSFHTQLTLALGENLFHLTGKFEADLAIRNLYLEARDVILPGLQLWAGSRMYRGDDIYLLDFWPLDEQNTLGGGAAYFFGSSNLRLHVGMNRLDDSFQTQTIEVPAEEFGSREILFMDRQRAVFTLRGEHDLTLEDPLKLKLVLYGEMHTLPAGTRRTAEDLDEWLPADNGWLAGAEVSLWGFGEYNHVNLYLRYGHDLAAYDELAIPLGPGREKSAQGAKEFLVGLSANYEIVGVAGFLLGTYGRYFEDADKNVYDRDDLWELGFAFRPAWYLSEHFHLLAEANFQYLRPNGLSLETNKHEVPFVFEFGLMPSISLGQGSYSRPQLRLIYAVSLLNHAALRTYAPEDPRRKRGTRHYLGLSVEWWFHSSRYGQ